MTPTGPGRTAVEVTAALTDRLTAAGVPTPDVDAELIVRHVLGWSRTRYLIDARRPLSRTALALVDVLGRRRADREPLQHITGTVGFRHLDLLVRPGVFVPRPETEVLAGAAIERVPSGGVVVEPCTGSGAVACAVATEADAAVVVATDVSPRAVLLARDNALRTGARVDVRLGDLLDPVGHEHRGRIDVLVCNPPYVAEEELGLVEPEVALHDPRAALVAGPTGAEVSDRLVGLAPVWLRSGGWVLLELAEARVRAAAERAGAAGLHDVSVLRDLTGRDRVLVARRP